MINARGVVVLYVFVLVACGLAGYLLGKRDGEAKWERWTYAHVAFETKGDRK